MYRSLISLLAALVLLFGATDLRAQCTGSACDVAITATVRVAASLSCVNTRNFDFGVAAAGSILESNENNHGRLRCETDPDNLVNISFTLTPTLADGLGHAVPVSYGVESAIAYDGEGGGIDNVAFAPSAGFVGFAVNTGVLTISLGENGPNIPERGVFVDLTGARPGRYNGSLTVTVALQ
jgi:hypothetical protein